MGNMPNKWMGRAAAVGLAILAGVGGWFLGAFVGDALANGFTFDWYVHATESRYPVREVLMAVSGMTTLGAVLGLVLFAGPTYYLTNRLARRVGYVPPRLKNAVSLDVHAVRLGFVLGQLGLLAALLLYVYFSFPIEWSGSGFERMPPYGDIKPSGYALLMALGGALGAVFGAGGTILATYMGVVSGHLAKGAGPNVLARVSIFGMRNARTTVALVLAATMVAGYYASTVTTNVDVADVMPRGDSNTVAAKNLTSKFKSSFTQAVTWQFRVVDVNNTTQMNLFERENEEKLPNRIEGADKPINPNNISDELYVRAMAEVVDFVTAQEPFVGSVGSPDFFKLVNWTIAGGNNATYSRAAGGDGSFSLPPTDQQGEMHYTLVDRSVFNLLYSTVDAVTSPTWRQTAVLTTVDPKSDVDSRYIGQRAFEVREMWLERVERGQTEYKIFGPENPPMFTYDLPLANAHASELTQHDFKVLLPIIAVFIALTLFIAFRRVSNVIVTFSALAISVTWTFGAMGAMEIPLNTINLAVLPLIMGIGIDYAIHMMNEYQEYRSKGKSAEEAWMHAGQGSAFALFVGALTTITGLTVMIVSPSLVVAQLGQLGAIAIASTFLLSILFIPAAVSLFGDRGATKRVQYAPSRIMPALASAVSRTRVLVVLVVLLLTGAAIASAANLRKEAFGDPPRNWLEDDEHRLEHEDALRGFYDSPTEDVKANILIIEGDMTDPRVHDYIKSLTATLRRNAENGTYVGSDGMTRDSRVIADTLKDLPFLVDTYLTVKDGAPGAGQYLGGKGLATPVGGLFDQSPVGDPSGGALDPVTEPYPSTRTELRTLLDEVFESPLYQFGNLFIDFPTYEMSVIVFSAKALTYDDAESVWNEVQAAIAENGDEAAAAGVKTSYFGNTAINYLFVAKQVPWLTAMNTVTILLITVIVFAFTRKLLPTLTVGLVSYLTSTLWFGLLPTEQVDIGLAINLTLPLIFITAMGSDYALHLAMRCQRTGDTYETFESVGKGVLFSFVTTIGSFLVFTQISDLSGRRSIIGTVLAIATVFAVTLFVVPVLFPVKKKPAGHGPAGHSVPIVEARANRTPQRIQASAPAPAAAVPAPENGDAMREVTVAETVRERAPNK